MGVFFLMAGTQYEDFRLMVLKFSADRQHGHQLFFKPHNVRAEEPLKPRDRTLFLANIPPWATVKAITRIFQKNGPVEAVYFQHEPSVGPPPPPPMPDTDSLFQDPTSPYNFATGFRFGYVVYKMPQGVRNAMTKMDILELAVASTIEQPIVSGVKRWAQEYNNKFVEEEKLLENVKSYMEDYDKKVAEAKLIDERLSQPDEDGWVTVTKKQEKKPEKRKKAAEDDSKKGRGKKNRRKKKKVELTNFYSHQIKEDKMNNIRALREKFEEDKQKIAKMKQERKFRPF